MATPLLSAFNRGFPAPAQHAALGSLVRAWKADEWRPGAALLEHWQSPFISWNNRWGWVGWAVQQKAPPSALSGLPRPPTSTASESKNGALWCHLVQHASTQRHVDIVISLGRLGVEPNTQSHVSTALSAALKRPISLPVLAILELSRQRIIAPIHQSPILAHAISQRSTEWATAVDWAGCLAGSSGVLMSVHNDNRAWACSAIVQQGTAVVDVALQSTAKTRPTTKVSLKTMEYWLFSLLPYASSSGLIAAAKNIPDHLVELKKVLQASADRADLESKMAQGPSVQIIRKM